MQTEPRTCKHASCKCVADAGNDYCGSYCEEAAAANQPEGATCRCGHAACRLPEGVPVSAIGGG